jgi:hypothetical protein
LFTLSKACNFRHTHHRTKVFVSKNLSADHESKLNLIPKISAYHLYDLPDSMFIDVVHREAPNVIFLQDFSFAHIDIPEPDIN